jgi:hypothetical protein
MEIDMVNDERMGSGEEQRESPGAWLFRCFGTPADRRNQLRLLVWTFAWALGFTAAAQTVKGNLSGVGLEVEGGMVWVVAVLPNVLAVGVLLAYLRLLRMADELTRLIQLQALAVGFGSWFFYRMAWDVLETAGARPPNDWDLLAGVLGMSCGMVYSAWRYR